MLYMCDSIQYKLGWCRACTSHMAMWIVILYVYIYFLMQKKIVWKTMYSKNSILTIRT